MHGSNLTENVCLLVTSLTRNGGPFRNDPYRELQIHFHSFFIFFGIALVLITLTVTPNFAGINFLCAKEFRK